MSASIFTSTEEKKRIKDTITEKGANLIVSSEKTGVTGLRRMY